MTTITPEEYERAVELAKKYTLRKGGIKSHFAEWDADELADALLHAHAQRRTAATVEVCQYYHQPSCGDNEDYDNLGACGRKSCPRKATP